MANAIGLMFSAINAFYLPGFCDIMQTMAQEKKTSAAKDRPVGASGFDATDAAQAAAAIVAHQRGGHVAPATPAAGDAPTDAPAESSGFKNLKDSINKPHATALGNMLDKSTPAGKNKPTQAFAFGKQVGHNQTFGADVNRRSVPRRTAG